MKSAMARVRTVASAAALSILFAVLLSAQSARPVDRIQLGRYVDPVNNIDDPLNELVQIRYVKGGDKFAGTGTFLEGCRIIGALHVLLNMFHGDPEYSYMKDPNESLVGEKFDFVTNPVMQPTGKKEKIWSSFVVLGHGTPIEKELSFNGEEDWFVGYNQDCISDKLKLGFVILITGQRFDSMSTRQYMTAGFSQLPAAKNERGEYALYIDSKCNVTDTEYVNDSYILTTCSFWDGGSGQLLMTVAKKRGKIEIGPNGHPIKLGHAIFQTVESHLDFNIPNIKGASGVGPFTYDLWNKLLPHLEGPVDIEKLAQIALKRRLAARVR